MIGAKIVGGAAEVDKSSPSPNAADAMSPTPLPSTRAEPNLHRMATGISWGLAGRAVGRLIAMLCHVLLARGWRPADYGCFGIGWAYWRLTSFIATLGLDRGVLYCVRAYASRYSTGDVIITAVWVTMVAAVVVSACATAWASDLAAWGFHRAQLAPVLRAYGPAIGCAALLRTLAAASTVDQRAHRAVIAEEIVQPVTFLVLTLVLQLCQLDTPSTIALALATSLSLGVGSSAWLLQRAGLARLSLPPRRGPWVPLFRFSLMAQLAGLLSMSIMWNDRLLAGHYLSPAAAGEYQGGAQLALSFTNIISAANVIFAPTVAKLFGESQSPQVLDETYAAMTRWALCLALPAFLVVCFEPEAVLGAIWGPEYAVAARPFVILCGGHVAAISCGTVGSLLVMTGHSKKWLLLHLFLTPAQIAAASALAPRYGETGIALVTALAVGGGSLCGMLLGRRLLHIRVYDRHFVALLAGAGACLPALAMFRSLDVHHPLLRAAFATVIAYGIFLATLHIFRRRIG